jgi:hypothetical protein
MLSHRSGAGPCSAVAGDSRFKHRVWAGRSPAELAIKSSPWPIGWRQSSHNSGKGFPAGVAEVSDCGGSHAEVFPNITRHAGVPSATEGTLDRLHSGRAHSSVFPKTNRHVQGDVEAAAITTSVVGPAEIIRGSVASPKTQHATGQMARRWKASRAMPYKLLREWKMREEERLCRAKISDAVGAGLPGWSIRSDRRSTKLGYMACDLRLDSFLRGCN